MIRVRFGSFRKQSTKRKILNMMGLPLAVVVLVEIFLRVAGFLFSLQVLHFKNFWQRGNVSEYTILCIGDSWTAGQPSGNYPDDLQEALTRINPSVRFRVINAGIGGGNSSQALRRLIQYLPKHYPDMVIVMTGNNDHWNLSESVYWKFADQEMNTVSILKAKARVFSHSLRVYKLGKILYYKLTGLPTPNQFYYAPTEDHLSSFSQISAIDPETHRKQLEYNLIQLIELAQTNNFRLILQTYFHFHGYHVNEIIRDIATTYHIPLVDNNILFHQKISVAEREHYLIPDGHPSAAGYKFIVDNILNVARENKLIPTMTP
jgi:lysophospholipase L1-like esterase